MDVCEWLEDVEKLDNLIDAKLVERDQLMALATKITPDMDGMPHAKGNKSDKVGNTATKLAEKAKEIDLIVDQYVNHKQEVIDALERLPNKEYSVLHRYYIRYMTLAEIAEDMGYSIMQIWRIKEKGLNILEDVIEC